MDCAMIAFFALTVGVIAGFFAASLFAVGHMHDMHESYQRKWITREKEHLAEVEFLKRKP